MNATVFDSLDADYLRSSSPLDGPSATTIVVPDCPDVIYVVKVSSYTPSSTPTQKTRPTRKPPSKEDIVASCLIDHTPCALIGAKLHVFMRRSARVSKTIMQ
jgi:hypothetical protein